VLPEFGGQARGVVTEGIDVSAKRKARGAEEADLGQLGCFDGCGLGTDGIDRRKQLSEVEWKLRQGDYVTLTSSPQGRMTPFGVMQRTKIRVAACSNSGFYDYDEGMLLRIVAGGAVAGRRGRHGECAGVSADDGRNWRNRLRRWWNKPRGGIFRTIRMEGTRRCSGALKLEKEIGDGQSHRADKV